MISNIIFTSVDQHVSAVSLSTVENRPVSGQDTVLHQLRYLHGNTLQVPLSYFRLCSCMWRFDVANLHTVGTKNPFQQLRCSDQIWQGGK
jgi:hypothetical protein